MAKTILKNAGSAAAESLLQHLMPQLDARLNSIQNEMRDFRGEIRALDVKVDSLRDEMLDRFERHLHVMNEMSERITRLDGKMEGYMEAMRLFVGPQIISPQIRTSKKRAG